MTNQRSVSCGLDFSTTPDLASCLVNAHSSRYEFISTPLVHPQFKREFISGSAKNRPGPFTRTDLILCSSDWSNLIIGKLSPYIDVDSNIPEVRKNSEETLKQELSLASHLGLQGITFKLTRGRNKNVNLSRIIYEKLATPYCYQMWVQVPMANPAKQSYSYRNVETSSIENPWEWWNSFRALCDYDKKLGVALIVSHDLPDMEEIDRWLGEQVKCLVLPTTLFITNKKGYPVLSKAHQTVIRKFYASDRQFLLTGANRYQNIGYYYHYLDYLWKSCQVSSPLEQFARGFEDFLQCPLQPLMDNLESQTYEIFEKDNVKYAQYEEAIHLAILHLSAKPNYKYKEIVIMVVGAGRGPIVRAALSAANLANKEVRCYAVEKNPNAVITLQALAKDTWNDKVTVVSSDMRQWEAPEKADILVSELLGSFGDNELSPECLDGVQKFLSDDGVSIPSSYTSYINPIQCSKVFNEVKSWKDKDKNPLSHLETSYVVHLQSKYDIAKPQPLFTFVHPNKDDVIDNSRFETKTFEVKQDSILHGFSGYFHAVLYDKVTLSIEPSTHSPNMFSWFPIFFPIREPVQLKEGDQIVVHFWRRCTPKNVWYEWCISKPSALPIHNINGRSFTIGL
ncbi:protein arginine N-methyltransferase 5 [Prorops nasuta]|uniref:protein arginine N-methyltransferase 5 n=1 Tax=Prorops nasuta TaxID=863751 RepID=UPI0034CF314D